MSAPEKTFALALTKDELTVLQYVIDDASSPYAADPLKDIYELGDDEPEEPYEALKTGAAKFLALDWDA